MKAENIGETSPLLRVTLAPLRLPSDYSQISSFTILKAYPFIIFFKSPSLGHMKSISPLFVGSWTSILNLGTSFTGPLISGLGVFAFWFDFGKSLFRIFASFEVYSSNTDLI